MNRIEEINNELKTIKECEAAHRFLIGIQANGGESENAFLSWSNRYNDCLILLFCLSFDAHMATQDSVFGYLILLINIKICSSSGFISFQHSKVFPLSEARWVKFEQSFSLKMLISASSIRSMPLDFRFVGAQLLLEQKLGYFQSC